MKAIEILTEEHGVIRRLLDSLEAYGRKLEEREPMRPGFFVEAADFIRGYGDIGHHTKEEGLLFPALKATAIAEEDGPIAVSVAEHDEARRFMHELRSAAEKTEAGDITSAGMVAWTSTRYVKFMREHIRKEEEAIFPVADTAIQGAKRLELDGAFERQLEDEAEDGDRERYLGILESLEKEAKG